MSATIKVIQVVVVESTIGLGKEDNPFRTLTEYFDMDGKLILSKDLITNSVAGKLQ